MKFSIAGVMRIAAIATVMTPVLVSAAPTPTTATITATELMKAADEQARKTFATAIVKVKLSTCKYVVNNGNLTCKEAPRVTVLDVGE